MIVLEKIKVASRYGCKPGQKVVVSDAFGILHNRIASTPVLNIGKFPKVWVVKPELWRGYMEHTRAGTPWPSDDVIVGMET